MADYRRIAQADQSILRVFPELKGIFATASRCKGCRLEAIGRTVVRHIELNGRGRDLTSLRGLIPDNVLISAGGIVRL